MNTFTAMKPALKSGLRSSFHLAACLLSAVYAQGPCGIMILGPDPVFVHYGETLSLNCTLTCNFTSIASGWETSLRKLVERAGSGWTWTNLSVKEWISSPTCFFMINADEIPINKTTIIAYNPPDSVSIDLPAVMEVGRSYNLTCSVLNVAPKRYLTVVMKRGSDVLHSESYAGDQTNSSTNVTLIHSIIAHREDHGAEYTCLARLALTPNGELFENSSSITVSTFDLPEEPSIHVLDFVETGSQVTATCEGAGAFPLEDVEVTLLLDSIELHGSSARNGGILTVEAALPLGSSGNRTLECRVTMVPNGFAKTTKRFVYFYSFPEPILDVKEVNTLADHDVKITCTLPETDPLEALITIRGNDNMKTCKGRSTISCHLALTAQKEDHGQNITCQATLGSVNAMKATSIMLNVSYAPEFDSIQCPSTRTWIEGGQAAFFCAAIGNPAPHVQCTKDGGTNVIGDWSGITREQAGVYECLATNDYGHTVRNVTVRVEHGPEFSDSLCSSAITWVEGTQATFVCEASGHPAPHIYCTKDGGPNAIRHWPNITRHDSGTYRCNASNRHGVAVKNVAVTVEYKPEFSDALCPSPLRWVEKTQATFSCEADGNPAPRIECSKSGETDAAIPLHNITRQHSGTYQCNARNRHGFDMKNVTVIVEYKPEFSESLCPSSLTWVEGDEDTFSCMVNGNPVPHVECTKDGFREAIGQWHEITRHDSGSYKCKASNKHGVTVNNVTVTVEYKSEFNDSLCPSPQIFAEGETTAMFSCEAEGNPAPHVECSKDGRPLSSIYWRNITRNHSGTYQCYTNNRHGVDSRNITVIVEYGPELSDLMCPRLVTWVEGADNTFSCSAHGNPTPLVECRKDGGPNVVGHWLKITREHSGAYQCNASNRHSFLTRNITVIIEYGPEFTDSHCPSRLLWVEGAQATFSCKADGNPAPRVECTKDGGPNAIGHWQNISRHDAGFYQCIARNGHRSHIWNVEVTVEYRPKFISSLCPSHVTLIEEKPATFSCRADGRPAPLVQCTKDGGKNVIENWPKIGRNASGSYWCNATNKHGYDTKDVRVSIEYKPTSVHIEIDPSGSIYKGGTVTLTCKAHGLPEPTYHWNSTYSSSLTFSLDNSTITIAGAKVHDSGVYTCEARNKHGRNHVKAEILVKDTAPIILGAIFGALGVAAIAGIAVKIYLLHRARLCQKYQVSRAEDTTKKENLTNSYTKMAPFQICEN